MVRGVAGRATFDRSDVGLVSDVSKPTSERTARVLALRILAGGFCMWALVNALWILTFVYLEWQQVRYSDYDLALLIYTSLIIAWPLGGLWAWMRRPVG